ncbi:MAG: FAD-binding protein [bacterium]
MIINKEISTWTLNPKLQSKIYKPDNYIDIKKLNNYLYNFLVVGKLRSYSDSIFETLVKTTRYNYILDYNKEEGYIECTSGITLQEIINFIIKDNYFLLVTPGTKYITLGGAISNDVHGKNHHIHGSFSESILEIEVLLPNNQIIKINDKNNDIYKAIVGGIGLIGIILKAKIKLLKIPSPFILQKNFKTKNFNELIDKIYELNKYTYNVVWLDLLNATKNNLNSIIQTGEFINYSNFDIESLINKSNKKINIPNFLKIKDIIVKIFNYIYYLLCFEEKITDYNTFFYPLDKIYNWNILYKPKGFLQYQIIINSEEALEEIIYKITKSNIKPYLSILKFHKEGNNNFLSFPTKGFSLALDFKLQEGLYNLLNEIDNIVIKNQGRIYLAKDNRIDKNKFMLMYPKINEFKKIRQELEAHKKYVSLQSMRLGL